MRLFPDLPLSVLFFLSVSATAKDSAGAKISKAPVNWYLATVDGKAVGAYSDSFSRKDETGRALTVQEWITKRGDVSRIEAITTSEKELPPVSFNLHYKSADGASELRINAILQRQPHIADLHYKMIRALPAPLTRDEKKFPMAPNTIFYSTLPRYLAKHESGMYSVNAIMEDIRTLDYVVKILQIRRTAESKKIGALTCDQSYVSLNGPMAEIWVAKDGTL